MRQYSRHHGHRYVIGTTYGVRPSTSRTTRYQSHPGTRVTSHVTVPTSTTRSTAHSSGPKTAVTSYYQRPPKQSTTLRAASRTKCKALYVGNVHPGCSAESIEKWCSDRGVSVINVQFRKRSTSDWLLPTWFSRNPTLNDLCLLTFGQKPCVYENGDSHLTALLPPVLRNNFRPKSDTLHRQGWPHGANFSPRQFFYSEFKISPKTP